MTDSTSPEEAAGERSEAARPGKRDRLIGAARELVHQKGVAATTLADIAQASDILVGNLYYYFKTKDDIVNAVVRAHADELTAGLAALERTHRTPRTRLKALVQLLSGRRESIATYGCRFGTLGAELAKRSEGSDQTAAPIIRIPLDWAEEQFRAMGRADAPDLALDLVAAYHGSALLAHTLGQPDLMAHQARRLTRWIDSLAASSRLDERG